MPLPDRDVENRAARHHVDGVGDAALLRKSMLQRKRGETLAWAVRSSNWDWVMIIKTKTLAHN